MSKKKCWGIKFSTAVPIAVDLLRFFEHIPFINSNNRWSIFHSFLVYKKYFINLFYDVVDYAVDLESWTGPSYAGVKTLVHTQQGLIIIKVIMC